MGSGFKQFTASVLTASDLNNYLMEQTVMSFASTGARDVTVTAPEDGMVAYIRSNDSSEGLYTYNGTSWRKGPGWNAPWGAVAAPSTKTSSPVTFTTTSYVDFGVSLTFTNVQNRMYRCTFQSIFDNAGAAALIGEVRIYNNTSSTQLQQGNYSLPVAAFTTVNLGVVYTASSTASVTIKVQCKTSASSFRSYADAAYPAFLSIEDIGPNGAPV